MYRGEAKDGIFLASRIKGCHDDSKREMCRTYGLIANGPANRRRRVSSSPNKVRYKEPRLSLSYTQKGVIGNTQNVHQCIAFGKHMKMKN